ncbi:O-antigen ligase family protein [Streptosporangium amethystogenes]|uniref:O-antigen ligase family protein n=1 Tax=Streptosporangium amethystogenes TaxID=2002 RepID=UPI00068FD7C2|nr:O-antigen ligase family protein [Streptosporangium amethystogenes]
MADRPALPTRRRADAATLACVFAVALLVVPARMVFRGLPLSITPASLVALAATFLCLCAHLTLTLGMAKGRNPVRTALLVFLTAMVATFGYATFGYMPSDELNLADHALILLVANAGLALLVCDGVRGTARLDFVLQTVVVAGAIIAVIGACQFLLDLDLTRYMEFPGLRYTAEDGFITLRSDFRRVAATTGHPIEFGVVCAMLLPIAVHYGFQARERSEPALRWWVCSGLIGMGLMFSVSRSAVLGLVGVAVVLFLGWPARRRLQALGVVFGFLVLMRIMVPGLLGTFYGLFANFGNDDSIRYRTHDYEVAAHEIAKHLWLGRGAGTWYAPKHQVFDNQYILSTVETGLIGVGAIVGMFACAFYAGLRARHLSTDPGTRDLGLTLAACMVVPLIGAATFDLMAFATATGLSFLLIGAAGALLRAATEPAASRPREPGASSGAPGAGDPTGADRDAGGQAVP